MKIKTDQATVDALKAAMQDIDGHPENVRVYLAGMGWGGPSFGLALDELHDDDYVDNSNDIPFVMEKSTFDRFGDMEIKSMGDGFSVIPALYQGGGGCSC